jgi:hypothetical protein
MIEIRSFTDAVLFVSSCLTLKDAVIEAVSKRANLYGADLSGADLSGADLSRANLSGANLYRANLYGANLYGADLYRANLYRANLYGADLYRANLYGADLYRANLYGANLYGADLSGANLYGANLYGANLYGADLYGADLSGADLSRANLSGKKIHSLRAFSGLYCYQVWAVVFEDGSRWIRMGCLFYDLDKWEKIGIRNSNVSEYPNDGSELCEERVAAFEFAKAAALRMTAPPVAAEATHV